VAQAIGSGSYSRCSSMKLKPHCFRPAKNWVGFFLGCPAFLLRMRNLAPKPTFPRAGSNPLSDTNPFSVCCDHLFSRRHPDANPPRTSLRRYPAGQWIISTLACVKAHWFSAIRTASWRNFVRSVQSHSQSPLLQYKLLIKGAASNRDSVHGCSRYP